MFFANYRIIPPVINNVKVLKGIESNIMDKDGAIDVPERIAGRLEIVSASLHEPCIRPGSKADNTSAVLGAIEQSAGRFYLSSGQPDLRA